VAKTKTTKAPIKGVAEQLRSAIVESELTLHAIAQGSGVAYPQIYHFAHRARDLRLATADRLCAFLKLELRPI
jgi:hypothetical protein